MAEDEINSKPTEHFDLQFTKAFRAYAWLLNKDHVFDTKAWIHKSSMARARDLVASTTKSLKDDVRGPSSASLALL